MLMSLVYSYLVSEPNGLKIQTLKKKREGIRLKPLGVSPAVMGRVVSSDGFIGALLLNERLRKRETE